MNESHFIGYIAGAMQFTVAGYALRLNRRFGTGRVGWSLFGAFSFLALLQLIQSTASFEAGANAAVKINVTYALISFLLLIGLVHMETMLKERMCRERLELELRAELEAEVKSKTAHLSRAIDELMREIEETKRMSAIIESTEWTMAPRTTDGIGEGASEPMPANPPVEAADEESEHLLAGIMSAEWVGHF